MSGGVGSSNPVPVRRMSAQAPCSSLSEGRVANGTHREFSARRPRVRIRVKGVVLGRVKGVGLVGVRAMVTLGDTIMLKLVVRVIVES